VCINPGLLSLDFSLFIRIKREMAYNLYTLVAREDLGA
jgi:hypothetical protein